MQRFLPLARSMGESEEPDLMAMLLDDFYQETFHAALVPPEPEEAPGAARGTGGSKRPHADRGGRRRSGRPRR
jgi:ATP-dependent RNA helicase DeaD